MRLISNPADPRVIDALAITLAQATQLARTRLVSAASPILRLMMQRDQEVMESELLRREADILRAGRANMLPQKRPDYPPAQRLTILQLMRLRGWNIKTTAKRFVLHENTVRAWLKAAGGNGKPSLFAGAVVWNRLDDAVRWAAQELRRLCPEPEFGTRTMARHLLRAGIQISRSTVQRVLREPEPQQPPQKPRAAMEEPAGIEPHDLLMPKKPNHVWHSDITQIRVFWFTFFIAAILDGFSRKILALKVYAKTPCARNMAALVRGTAASHGGPKFLITDNGSQFRKQFGKAMRNQKIRQVRTGVRAPFLNGKSERSFRTFKLWARWALFGLSAGQIQRRLDKFRDWYNPVRPQSALGIRAPNEAYSRPLRHGRHSPDSAGSTQSEPKPVAYKARDGPKIQIEIARRCYRHDPHFLMIGITVRRAA